MRVEHIGNAMLYLTDCMKLMAKYPDKHFNIAITDPPYGIGQDWKKKEERYKLYQHDIR